MTKTPVRTPNRPTDQPQNPRLTPADNSRLSNWMPQTDAATVALARDGVSEAFRALLMLSTEVQDRVAGAMSSLSAMERAAFALRHFEGRSIDEISRALGLKANATKHSIFRAVKKMRVALEPLVSAD